MENDLLITLLRMMQVEMSIFLIFFFGFRNRFNKAWQIKITFGLLTLLTVTLAIFIYIAYLNNMIRNDL